MAKKYDCTLLVNSCDKYHDILDLFFELLHRFWPDLPFEITLTTETLEYKNEYFKINNIHPQNKECTWTERIAETLKAINTDYVFFMLDDFFLYDYVKTDVILDNLKHLKNNDNIVNFTYWPILNRSEECGIPGFRKRGIGANYKVAAIAALWNKKQFLKYVDGYKENIWEFEPKGTIRSNMDYPEDEFYVSKDYPTQVIPYDFTKYGLFSGKWFRANKELEERLGIKIDYKARGFYNEKERGLTKSFISAFKIASYLIPKYNFTKDNPIHYYEVQKPGYFEQEYNISGAKDIVYWLITDQWGFMIKNLSIDVTYRDKSVTTISNKDLFGNFFRLNNCFIFNKINPCVYIPTQKNKTIEKIKIKGFLKVPISKILTHISYNRMRWNKPEFEQLKQDINRESLLVNDLVSSITLAPEARIIQGGMKSEKIIKFEELITKENFKYTFKLDKEADEIEWIPSNCAGFSISDLKVTYKVKDNKVKIIDNNMLKGLPQKVNGQYIFLQREVIIIKLPNKKVKDIYISGKIQYPIDKEILSYLSNKK